MDFQPLADPPAIVWEAKKPHSQRRRKAALAVGMLIVLDDGRQCLIVGFKRDRTPLCDFPPKP